MSDEIGNPQQRRFETTRWSLVIAAARKNGVKAGDALGELCRIYWFPLYAFVRRMGYSADDASDLTQGFFARLLEKNDIASADQRRGKFRSWLLASIKHYCLNEWDKARAQKRGGGKRPISFDIDDAESRYRLEPSHDLTPERVFDRRWAMTLLEQVLKSLKDECDRDGKAQLFDALKVTLTGHKSDETYEKVAEQLDMSAGAVKVAAHRLRRRYRDLLRETIAETVEKPEHVDDEIRDLFDALG